MKAPQLRTRGLVCGTVTTALVTLLVTADMVPMGWKSPEAAAALTGLLASLAAAFGLCDQYEDRRRRVDDDGELPK